MSQMLEHHYKIAAICFTDKQIDILEKRQQARYDANKKQLNEIFVGGINLDLDLGVDYDVVNKLKEPKEEAIKNIDSLTEQLKSERITDGVANYKDDKLDDTIVKKLINLRRLKRKIQSGN